MELLENPVRAYAWGSRTVIADLLGEQVPSPHPQAEMWLGAHPADPSRVVHGDGQRHSLLDAVAGDPVRLLGAERAARWDATLPFLLKVLAADEPLSLQAHPSIEQARAGFAKEEAAGVPRDAADRNYRDANHKPELICALTEFHALVGFRAPAATVVLLHALDVPEIAPYTELLAAQPDADGLRALFTTWITLPQSLLDTLVPALQAGCVRLAGDSGELHTEARTVLELSERYPGDAGVLAALLLNRVTLQPGEALYLPAGNLHAYLQGAGIELMASSDNVLRGGLTPKHVDVPELMRVLDFCSGPPPVLTGTPDGAWVRYDTPAQEFLLRRLESDAGLTSVPVPDGGPRILLCTAGSTCVRAGRTDVELKRGGSAWLSAEDRGVHVLPRAEGTQLFLAGDGLA
ncbi:MULTISPECIES: mannose-6-phosphate isomerase, class I [unclassified Pseudonocardia]|uniref:mannose-6-phosphate isomerase, class I n=1 Tax=unclassified Pseudonocardia TaxID=2619320 RepID=UPI00095CBAC7|nr:MULTISPECIES: mannose-6-phosphate isomerase, class I [unclassified Pseudonocardia]MBN9097202.1 mannose-6-phosphate isomerase, class I [Pseudonocardia sp.]OJY39497.1 MAG: mannose-6-phosphate isomerase, class I [Pseudonocardia sp. 73-21]